jgi:hypothetical protein
MNNISPVEAFAIVSVPGSPSAVRRLPLTQQAQDVIAEVIREQLPIFCNEDIERVPFDPTYRTQQNTVLCIEGFQLPDHICEAIDTPLEVPEFEKAENVRRIRALFYVSPTGNVFFQCWRNFEVMNRNKVWLLLSGNTFAPVDDAPLVIDRRIDAVFWDEDLLFKSYANASSMLEMLDYVAEATAEDIHEFVAGELFVGDVDALNGQCSRLHRKQIRLLVQSGALKLLAEESVETLIEKAAEVSYELPIGDDKVKIPNGGKELTALLHFLNDRFYRGLIRDNVFIAESARVKPGK